MTTSNNTLKNSTPTKQKTLAGIRKQRRDSEAKAKAQAKKDGAKLRQKYKSKKKKG